MEKNIFLASFPRSGNTWLRFLIANVYNTLCKQFEEIDFHNIHDIIPELKKNGTYEEPHYKDFPFVIKTHSPFTKAFENTILLVRNPFDAILSYWDFLNHSKGLKISLPEMVAHDEYGIQALVIHTNSYEAGCPNLLIVTYERLKLQTHKELNKICRFIHLNINEDIIKKASKESSFKKMRTIESKKGRKFGNKNFRFIRKGEVGTGMELIKKDINLYHSIKKTIMKSPLLHDLYGQK